MTKVILIIGGYGVFGGKLAMALAQDKRLDVIVAGRNLSKADRFCAEHGGRGLMLDTSSPDLARHITAQIPFLVVDAAGPFQGYDADYSVAKAAISCDAHYLDLSDDADFTKGICSLDTAAQQAGVMVLSGVSSVPAMSSAAVQELSKDMVNIHLIDSVILPGNRAPRGMSVMRAILAQVGKPVQIWRGGRYEAAVGWSEMRSEELSVAGVPTISGRRSSLIGAPDLALFPEFFKARSVEFRAGLDLWVMHWGLTSIGWIVRLRLLRSAEPLSRFLKWVADLLEPFGSDRGGMRVRVVGELADGTIIQREWTLIAEDGDGPHIPAVAARVMCMRLLEGDFRQGARPCLAEFPIQQAEDEMADLQISFSQSQTQVSALLQQVLDDQFDDLPKQLQDLHSLTYIRRWQGAADITRGGVMLAGLICRIAGFPAAGKDVPVTVTMHRKGNAEHWQRNFNGKRFSSVITSAGKGQIWERFGPFNFRIPLNVHKGTLSYPVSGARLFGLPWPKLLTPKSDTFEYVDDEGRARFDVAISLPFFGPMIRYQGWLESNDAPPIRP